MSANVRNLRQTPVAIERGLYEPIGLELPRNPGWVGVARLTAAAIAYRAGMSYDAIEDIKIMVAEAVSYCIQYGGTGGRLMLSFEVSPETMSIVVRDPAFPQGAIPKDRNGSTYRTFVDGLFLIRGLADEVHYDVQPGEGLTLSIRRSRG